VLLTSFLVGPFVQQASRTKECSFPVPGLNASLPFARYVLRQGGLTFGPNSEFDRPSSDIVVAIMSTVTAADGLENKISASCATGNCTFPNGDPTFAQGEDFAANSLTIHSTMGMCSNCIDIASLSYRDNRTEYFLPNGFNISSSYGIISNTALIRPTPDLAWLGDMLSPDSRALSRWAYTNVTFLAEGKDQRVAAAVCILYPCLRTYTSSVINNQLIERQV
jgi:hypothetical protein